MKIIKYTDDKKAAWNELVARAKNGHFFFYRDYMEYHRDRFTDFSLMVYDEKERLVAILPANIRDNEAISHGGLTFGGVVVDNKMTASKMLAVFKALLDFMKGSGIKKFIYKAMPYIYNKYPAEEVLYALFYYNARLVRRDVSSTICLENKLKYEERRRRAVKRGYKNNYMLGESCDYQGFVNLLDAVLSKYHGIHPVHTAAELELLAARFPKNIKLYTAEKNGTIEAGTLIFEEGAVVHTQYMANSDTGKNTGALDCLIDYLITEVYQDRKYFDFGISCENNGRYLNEGLAAQKEGFGARTVVQDFYEIDL